MEGRLPIAEKTSHYEYSNVFLTDYPPVTLFVLSSGEPIDFAEMPKYFSQIEAIDQTAHEAGLEQIEDSSPIWLYHNQGDQPLDPSGNTVRSPFVFEIGYPIAPIQEPFEKSSPEGGVFMVKRLRALSVASIIYRGSFPYQENSGFVEACQTLLPAIEAAGLSCAHTLYREIYHLTDWEDPTQSFSEVQIELGPRLAG